MGSGSSKTKIANSQAVTAKSDNAAAGEGRSKPENPDAPKNEDDLLVDKIRVSAQNLKQSQNFDETAVDDLNEILKSYYLTSAKPKTLESICDALLKEDILKTFVRLWDLCHENSDEFYSNVEHILFKNLNRMKIIFWNFSDKCKDLATACYKDGAVIERLMRDFSLPQLDVPTLTQPRLRHAIKADLGILHNLVRHANQNRNHIRKNNGIDKILAYEKSTYLIVKAKVFIVLAYCINEEENSKIMAGVGVIAFILKILESALASPRHVAKMYSFSAEETVAALNKLASNDGNKKAIVDAGILPIVTQLLDPDTSSASENLEAVNCIWSLAFHPDNKQKIIEEPGLLEGVRKLRDLEGAGDRMKKAVGSLMFVLELEQVTHESHNKEGENKHIMLSYNWEVQHVMLKLRDFLTSQGIKIWMDVDNIHDSILSAMADAVENSSLIIVAMSESYRNSLPCRTEAEYSYQRAVPILPLLLQPGYKADGWLGAMVGTKLYVDLSAAQFEQKFSDVLREVRSLAAVSAKKKVAVNSPPSHAAPPIKATPKAPNTARETTVDGANVNLLRAVLPCNAWTVSQVQKWCSELGIAEDSDLRHCDGAALSQLCKILIRSPDIYYRMLREDLRLNFKDILLITSSVERLLLS